MNEDLKKKKQQRFTLKVCLIRMLSVGACASMCMYMTVRVHYTIRFGIYRRDTIAHTPRNPKAGLRLYKEVFNNRSPSKRGSKIVKDCLILYYLSPSLCFVGS